MPGDGIGAGGPDIISTRRDPDRARHWRVPWRRVPWRLAGAAAAIALLSAGIAVDVIAGGIGGRPGRSGAGPELAQQSAIAAMLHGAAFRPGAFPAMQLLLGGDDLRLLNVAHPVPAPLGWAGPLLTTRSVFEIAQVTGGDVVLLADETSAGPATGDVFFIPVTARGGGAPRLIARANYMAVTPDRRDIWVEQAGPPSGHGPALSPAWLAGESGGRLSPILDLHHQHLLAATTRGLLTQGASIQGVSLIDTLTGAAIRLGVPGNALIVGASADDLVWQPPASCAIGCKLNVLYVTSLSDGKVARISLPPNTTPERYADPSASDQAGRRIALVLDTVNSQGLATNARVYVADIGLHQLIRLPGGPIEFFSAPQVQGLSDNIPFVSVRWAAHGSGLWIVATDQVASFQAAYWPGSGPLQVLPAQPGTADMFAVAAG